jgi:hypothetical protein
VKKTITFEIDTDNAQDVTIGVFVKGHTARLSWGYEDKAAEVYVTNVNVEDIPMMIAGIVFPNPD